MSVIMDNFKNVDVVKLANIYFEGKVISRNIFLKNGSKKTIGVILPGECEFCTKTKKLMKIITGKLNLKLQNSNDCRLVTLDMQFIVQKILNLKLRFKN